MKQNKKLLSLFIALISLYSTASHAQNQDQAGARIGNVTFQGTGCGRGKASATISNDGQTLSVLFDDYLAEAGGSTRRPIDRKGCNIRIPLKVPPGHSVAVFKVDYRGFNSLPQNAVSHFVVDYFFGARMGPRKVQEFQGPLENEFISENSLTSNELTWSGCGRSHVLNAHSALWVRTNAARDQVMAGVDSADLHAGFVFKLQWKRCT